MVFPVVTYSCESWTVKKEEHQRTDAFELWGWRRLLSFPWTARRSSQSILRKINPEDWHWSRNSSILAIWCEQLTHWKSPWCWEKLRAEGEEGVRGWDGWMASLMQWTWTWENFGRWWGTGRPGMPQSMGSQRVAHDWATEQQFWSKPCLETTIKGKSFLYLQHLTPDEAGISFSLYQLLFQQLDAL